MQTIIAVVSIVVILLIVGWSLDNHEGHTDAPCHTDTECGCGEDCLE